MVAFLLFVELWLSSLLFPGSAAAAGMGHKSLDPVPGTPIVVHRDFVIEFEEPVHRGTGEIEVWKDGGTQAIGTINVSDTVHVQLDKSGTRVIIKLPQNLQNAIKDDVGQTYYLNIPREAFYSRAKNDPYAGVSYWNFTIKKFELISSPRRPENGQSFVDVDSSPDPLTLEFAFNDNVDPGTGYIRIRRKIDGVIVRAIDVASGVETGDVTIANNVVTVKAGSLAYDTEYYVTIDPGAFVDQHKNPFGGITNNTTWTFKTEPAPDTQKPKAVSYTPAVNGTLSNLQGDLIIEFDEPVFAAGGFINIRKNTSGQPLFCSIPVSAVTVNEKTVRISPGGYGCGAFENNTQYTVQIGDTAFRDASGNYYEGITNWTFRTNQDTTAPAVSSYSPVPGATNVSVGTKTFSILFNEPVQVVPPSATAQLFRTDNPGSSSTLSMAVDSSDNRKVNLTYSGANLAANTQYSITIPAGAIRDVAGNEFPGILGQYQWTFRTGGAGAAPVLEKAEMDGSAAIVLTFNVTLSSAHVPIPGDFYVTVNDAYRQVTGVSVNQNRVRLTLASGVLVGQTVRVSYSPDPSRHLQSVDGQKVAAFSNRAVTNTVDTTLPRPVSGQVTGNMVVLTFNRALAPLSSNAYQQFTVVWGGQVMNVTGASVSGNILSLTLSSTGPTDGAISVTYTPGTNPIRDQDGNYVSAFTDFYVRNPYDNQPPQLTGVTASGNKVTLVYNEGLRSDSVPPASSFTVTASNRTISVTTVAVSGNQVELTLSSTLTNGTIVQVSYVPVNPYLVDLAGNAAPAFSGYPVTVAGGKAQLVSATVNGAQLTLTYSSALYTGTAPLASQYSVTVDNMVAAVTRVSVSGSQVTLTLANPVRSGQTVRVSYNNSGQALRDAQNNVLDSFSGVTATNVTSTVNLGLDYAAGDAEKGLVLNYLAVTQGAGQTINGKAAVKYTVDATKLTGAFNAVRTQPGGIPQRVVFQVPSTQPGAIVAVPAGALLSAKNTVPSGSFVVEYGGHMFELPLRALNPSIVPGGIPSGAQILIRIESVSASGVTPALNRAGGVLVGTLVEFGVYVVQGTNETAVTEFDAYVRRAIAVPGTTQLNASLTVVRYDPESGEVIPVPTRIDRSGTQPVLTFMRKGASIYAVARKASAALADMERHWARSDVELLSAKFIVDAKTGRNFVPNEAVTRADFAKFIARGLGLASDRTAASRFRDVGANHAYASYIGAASKAGIVQGDPDGRFRPNDPITREEMATMMIRAITYAEQQVSLSTAALNKFQDRGRISSWALTSVAGCVNAGIIRGVTETRFEPKNNATRAEAAVMIKRMLEYVGFLEK
ncbi:MAG: hypothetical protein BAA02_11755 [Paenibacillaceae bacterium ZCTH02-B3]|nr:MAG: hypothetical protein BAA02_11755 [Paenibacillaceae bacterium ZCTH02-B3]